MPDFLHGIRVTETAASAGLAVIATAVIGLIATAPDADAAAFPLDRPVLVSEIETAIGKAGAGGTLKGALTAIADQARCPIVVVRVAPGADAEATELAIVGADANGVRTGMQALLASYAQLGVKPRIIGAPGLETEVVTTQLCLVAQKLRAMVYAAPIGETVAEVEAYAAGFTQRELMLIYPNLVRPTDVLGNTETTMAVAQAMGLRAGIDETQGWHKTLSNVPIGIVTGTTKDVSFDLQDPDCDANALNAANVTTIVRLNGRLRFWGNRTTSADENFVFESATRTAQVLAETMALGLSPYLDRPLVPSLARDIVEEINELFRKLKRAGQVLGAEAWFDSAKNPVEALKAGKLTISYKYTPVPPLESLTLIQEITDEYLADFGTLVAAA